MSTNNEDYHVGINRSIQPNSLEIFDMWQSPIEDEDEENGEFGNLIKIISIRDQELFLNSFNPQVAIQNLEKDPDEEKEELHIK